MALIKCENCGKEISDKATKCPNCNHSYELEFSLASKIILPIIATISTFFILSAIYFLM